MGKLSKAEQAAHTKAEDLIFGTDRALTFDEKVFCYENWNEAADVNIRELGAFHTPLEMAWDFNISTGTYGTFVDLCAGSGILSFVLFERAKYHSRDHWPYVLCIEYAKQYVDVGKRLVPYAEWVQGDALTYDALSHLPPNKKFRQAMSNPPFGPIGTSDYQGKFKGKDFEFRVMDRASEIAEFGSFILPQQSAPFQYSGRPYYERRPNRKTDKFFKETGIFLDAAVGIDTVRYKDMWKNTNIVCEIADAEFVPEIERMKAPVKLRQGDILKNLKEQPDHSVDLIIFNMNCIRHFSNDLLVSVYNEFLRIGTPKHKAVLFNGDIDRKSLRRTIQDNSSPGSVVMDPAMLVGEVGVQCVKLDRKFVGFEIESKYFEIGKSRITRAYRKKHV